MTDNVISNSSFNNNLLSSFLSKKESDPSLSSIEKTKLQEQTTTIVEFFLGSTLFALTAGLTYGFITATLTKISHLPKGYDHVFKSTKLFGNLGLIYGITGTLLIFSTKNDGYKERLGASAATAIALSVYKKSIGVGIGGALGFGALSIFAKWIDYNDARWQKSDTLKKALEPVYSTRRQPLIIYKSDNDSNDNNNKKENKE